MSHRHLDFGARYAHKLVGKAFIDNCLAAEKEKGLAMSKERYLFSKFQESYPQQSDKLNYELIMKICTFNKALRDQVDKWLGEWRIVSTEPEWVKGKVSAEEYAKTKINLDNIKKAKAIAAQKIQEISAKRSAEIEKVEAESEKAVKENLKDDLAFIICIGHSALSWEQQTEYATASFIDDIKEREAKLAEIEASLQSKREEALKEYLEGRFDRSKYSFQGS